MLRRWRLLAVSLVAAMIVGSVLLGAFSLSAPVPAENQKQCLDAAKQSGDKHPDCPAYQTIFARGLSDPVAYYSLWLALFTGVLAVVAVGQGYMLNQQILLARDEFNAVHRPLIEILRVETIDTEAESDEPAASMQFTVQIFLANTGSGRAVTREFSWTILNGWPTGSDIMTDRDLKRTILASGERGSQIVIHRTRSDIFAEGAFHLVGQIWYQDAAGNWREAAFHWRTHPLPDTWIRVDGSGFNYMT